MSEIDKEIMARLKNKLSEANANLEKNTREVTLVGRSYHVIRPGELYPGVWGWDSAFHAIGLAHQSLNRALEELEVSALGQAKDGRIPSILFYDAQEAQKIYFPAPNIWQAKSKLGLDITGISQPPVFGYALKRALELQVPSKEDEPRIRELFDVAFDYQKFWYEHRDPEGNGLVVTVHPWETGRDNCAEWDQFLDRVRERQSYKDFDFDASLRMDNRRCVDPLHRPTDENYKMFIYLLENLKATNYSIQDAQGQYRDDIPFCMQDIGIISMLQLANDALIELCDEYGSTAQKVQLEAWRDLTTKNVRDVLWNDSDNCYQSRDVHTGQLTQVTNGSYLSFATNIPTATQISKMLNILDDWQENMNVKFNIPSIAPDHKSFESERYWRGPTWTIVNYVVVMGLLNQAKRYDDKAFYDAASSLMAQTLTLIDDDPDFYEYHDPLTGKGCGDKDFGFTSVALLELMAMVNK